MRKATLLGVVVVATALSSAGCDRRDSAPNAAPVSASALAPPADPRVAAGAASYAKYCALCHGADAKGYAADHAPSLVSETFLASATDDFLTRSIGEGRPGTAMAGYARDRGGPLDGDELSALIRFLRSKGPALRRLPAFPVNGVASRGADVYADKCQRCHGTREARGEAPHLANSAFLAAASDGFLRYAIANGRPGTPMEPFEGKLDDGSISDVVALLRSWAPNAPPVPPPPSSAGAGDAPLTGPVVIYPKGRPPTFTLREDRFVPIDQVKQALDAKSRLVIVDARATSDWLTSHIPGSVSVPYYQLSRLDALPNDGTWVLAYCACPHHASGVIVDELKKRGFKHAAILDEGILEWQKRNYPIDKAAPPAASTAPRR